MRYKSLSREAARQIRHHLINGSSYDLGGFADATGEGDDFDTSAVVQVAADALEAVQSGEDPEAVEHRYSGAMYLALRHVPVEVRDDKGFWRWLTLDALLPFTLVRESPPKLETLGIGSNTGDILAVRMFLRGQVTRVSLSDGSLNFDLAEAPGTKSHDFWQSHVLRRTTGAERDFARALISRQADPDTREIADVIRPFVRDHINRKKRTIATFLMSEDEAARFLAHEYSVYRPDEADDEDDDGLD